MYNDDIDDKTLKPDDNPICKELPKVVKEEPKPDFVIVVTGGGFTFDNVIAIIL